MKKLKIGFIMGGGVSMGAYSAGSLAYTLKALENNLNKDKYSGVVVDVFSGASAGSATLAITLFELIKGNEVDVELKKLWVDKNEGLDIANLMHQPSAWSNLIDPSLLSANKIKDIMNRIFKPDNLPKDAIKKKLILGDEVRISMSLSNLNGIRQDVSSSITNYNTRPLHDTTKTYWHGDCRYFKINLNSKVIPSKSSDKYINIDYTDADSWQRLGETARASGAFPFAFPPVALERESAEYGRAWSYKEDHKWFHYVDGGIFNNQPLKHAMNMAYELDENEDVDSFERFYIVIDPIVGTHVKDLEMENYCSPDKLESDVYLKQIKDNGFSVVNMLTSHAQYKDWQKAYKVNNQIEWFKELLRNMQFLISLIPDENLPATIPLRTILEDIIKTKYTATSQSKISGKIETPNRIAKQLKFIAEKTDTSSLSPKQTEIFLLYAAIIENTAGVRKKQKINLIGIAPKSKLTTKGDFLAAFGGFFKEEWRNYDFEVGQFDAFTKLKREEVELVNKANLLIVGDPSANVDPQSKDPSFSDIPPATIKVFKRSISSLVKEGIMKKRIKPKNKLKRFFKRLVPFKFISNIAARCLVNYLLKPDKRQPRKDCVHKK